MGDTVQPRVSLVTGATGAIAGAAVRELVSKPGTIVVAVRDHAKGEQFRRSLGPTSANVELLDLDLSDLESVRTAAAAFLTNHPSLHLLVNSAARFVPTRETTPAGFERMFVTNQLGPFLLTGLLLPALRAGAPSIVINVTAPSTTKIRFDDLDGAQRFSSFHAFGASKAANLLMTGALARRLAGSGVVPVNYFPGIVRSGLMREAPAFARFITYVFGRDPGAAGRALADLGLSDPDRLTPGGYYTRRGAGRAPAASLDTGAQDQLWRTCIERVGPVAI